MKTYALAFVVSMTLVPFGHTTEHPVYPYSPSMLTSENNAFQELEVFPSNGKAFRLPLPASLDVLAYGPDGKALYARHFGDMSKLEPPEPGLVKIEFNPTRLSALPGSTTLSVYYALAVSPHQDRLIISGHEAGASRSSCGIFELSLPVGILRKIVESASCDPIVDPPYAHWAYLSLSPDGRRAVALRNHHLELISLSDGKVSILGDATYEMGAWSPDGRWLAATKITDDNTRLLDAHTLADGRSIGATDLEWSPDSRYLLARRRSVLCGLGEVATFETVDLRTGKRTEVKSSKCLIDRARTGWVSSEISP